MLRFSLCRAALAAGLFTLSLATASAQSRPTEGEPRRDKQPDARESRPASRDGEPRRDGRPGESRGESRGPRDANPPRPQDGDKVAKARKDVEYFERKAREAMQEFMKARQELASLEGRPTPPAGGVMSFGGGMGGFGGSFDGGGPRGNPDRSGGPSPFNNNAAPTPPGGGGNPFRGDSGSRGFGGSGSSSTTTTGTATASTARAMSTTQEVAQMRKELEDLKEQMKKLTALMMEKNKPAK